MNYLYFTKGRRLKRVVKFRLYLESIGFSFIGNGSFRDCWSRGDLVIKVPKNHDGALDNIVESEVYKKFHSINGVKLAPCRLLNNGALVMLKVDTSVRYDEGRFDGNQVGIRKGQFYVYDYALDCPEFRIKLEKELGIYSVYFYTQIYREILSEKYPDLNIRLMPELKRVPIPLI
jgi:hypothetical protein